MDSKTIGADVDYLASGSGFMLSAEQKAALQSSLIMVKTHYKFTKVRLWGKIFGVKDDYFIIQGSVKDELLDRSTLYSFDCVEWHLLQPATEEQIENSLKLNGRFMGDPSYEYEFTDVQKIQNGDELIEEETQIQIKEEDRLAAVVSKIDNEARIVPRGAYIKTPLGKIVTNRSWEGLSVSEAHDLSSYFHFRTLQDGRTKRSLLQNAQADPAIDFLDCIKNDLPRGSWSVQMERGSGMFIIRSLYWLGMSFYHLPNTTRWGSLYAGTGERNDDLPFML